MGINGHSEKEKYKNFNIKARNKTQKGEKIFFMR